MPEIDKKKLAKTLRLRNEMKNLPREIQVQRMARHLISLKNVGDAERQRELKTQSQEKGLTQETLDNIVSSVDGDTLNINPEASEILRLATELIERTPSSTLAGVAVLTKQQVSHHKDALNRIAELAEEHNLDATKIDEMRENLIEALKKNGTAIIGINQEALMHERFHDVGFSGAAE